MDIGQFIKTRRVELKFSQRQVALHSRLSNATISRIESGAVIPDAATLSRIAKTLKLNPSILFKVSGYINEPIGQHEIESSRTLKNSKALRSFGARLRDLRKSAGYSPEEFCEATGYNPKTVSSWEDGSEFPDGDTIRELADFLGVEASYLTGKSDMNVSALPRRSRTSANTPALRETEVQDIQAVLGELRRAVENAQKVLAAYSTKDQNND